MTLALVDLRLPIFLVIAIVLLFGLAAWLSWDMDEAIDEAELVGDDEPHGADGRLRALPPGPISKQEWLAPERRRWR